MKALTATEFNFPGQKSVYHGKVRDVYNINGEKLVMVATDRISAFDVVLPKGIPFKGQMLNQIAAKFLDATTDICPNWKMATPDPMVTVGVMCEGFPVEMIVRGYLCGSAWRAYKSGVREICGVKLPEGMKENQKFPEPIITPTTKAEIGEHDADISKEEILADAKKQAAQGVLRYSIVTAGKALSDAEIDIMCDTIRQIRQETTLSVCVSFGLLTESQFCRLKETGVSRVHNNLETSERHFPNICTTHTFADKVSAIQAAQQAGLTVCSGGIMGMGETMADRIDMALALRDLGITSVPVNVLSPIPGTPFGEYPTLSEEEVLGILALYRFLLPAASIRMAGGRGLLPDGGKSCFLSGANAAITGDMLTTAGITVQTDLQMLTELGYEVKLDETTDDHRH